MAEAILVDTSVWIDHLRSKSRTLAGLLEAGAVYTHPFVIGELACGNLSRRSEILEALAALPAAPLVEHETTIRLIERDQLAGKGLGWVDVYLLASAQRGNLTLWTLDKRLRAAAASMGLARV